MLQFLGTIHDKKHEKKMICHLLYVKNPDRTVLRPGFLYLS